ncbi:MAG: hypothetical protein ACREAW_01575 [Nitrososphaera sp.]
MEKTKVSRAHSKFKGLKTAIPWEYAQDLGIEPGDGLIWEKKTVDGKKVLVVRKDND